MMMTRGVKRLRSDDHHLPCLPHELVMENILTRLPSKTLIRLSAVCKLWHNSIIHDPHFASSHFLHSQKKPRLVFNFVNVRDFWKTSGRRKILNSFFCLKSDDKRDDGDNNGLKYLARISRFTSYEKRRPVGYCNGLVCLLQKMSIIEIFNPNRREVLSIFKPRIHGFVICAGFGFDSLTKEYKVVLCHRKINKAFDLFHRSSVKCMVFTLGTDSWRFTTTDPPCTCVLPDYENGFFCGGNLFWKTRDERNYSEIILLSLDLHHETFQTIKVPAECRKERDLHLLEFKGLLCIARLENTLPCNPERRHAQLTLCRCQRHRGNNSTSRSRSRSKCMVHLYILKDKVKQEWMKEIFYIPSSLAPACPIKYVTTTDTIIIRLVSFQDRVLLSRYDKERLQLYDLHTKHLKEVKPCSQDDYHKYEYVDYYNHIENFLSLETFLPEGVVNYKSMNGDYKNMYNALVDILRKRQRPLEGVLCLSPQPLLDKYMFPNKLF